MAAALPAARRVKSDLRLTARRARAALAPEARRRQSEAIVHRLEGLAAALAPTVIAGYHPLAEEADPRGFLEVAASRGRVVALPRVEDGSLVLRRWRPGDALEPGRFPVLEPRPDAPAIAPADVDLCLVPGLAFDHRGHRLGYGHGYYCARCRARPAWASRSTYRYGTRFLPRSTTSPWAGWSRRTALTASTLDWFRIPEEVRVLPMVLRQRNAS
jgi:5-formyltetrahydrofolate cyclo-ligase